MIQTDLLCDDALVIQIRTARPLVRSFPSEVRVPVNILRGADPVVSLCLQSHPTSLGRGQCAKRWPRPPLTEVVGFRFVTAHFCQLAAGPNSRYRLPPEKPR